MAKKTTKTTAKPAVAEATTTPVRNSAVPPKSAATAVVKKTPPTREAIALKAYFHWQSSGGSEFDNWIRAERELSGL